MNDFPKLTKEELCAIASNICPDCRATGFLAGPRDGLCSNIKCAHPLCGSRFNVVSLLGVDLFAERISHPSPQKPGHAAAANTLSSSAGERAQEAA